MATSSAVVVKTQLVTVLAARAGLTGVQVTYVEQGDAAEQDCIYLGHTRGTNDYPVLRAGRKPRQEEYSFDLFCRAQRPESWASDSETRALALLAEVENAIADDPQIGLGATMPTLVLRAGDWNLVSVPLSDGGFGSVLRSEISVSSRLT